LESTTRPNSKKLVGIESSPVRVGVYERTIRSVTKSRPLIWRDSSTSASTDSRSLIEICARRAPGCAAGDSFSSSPGRLPHQASARLP